jgi:hypothetical protein
VKGRKPKDIILSRKESMGKIKAAFEKYQVKEVFAYNALCDAIDELEIMRLLGKSLEEYSVAII